MSSNAIYFGARALFGWYHAPEPGSPSRAASVVLCAPLGTDFTRGDRMFRHLAEMLAAAGFPTLRFDPFGTGDSPSDEHAPALVRAWLDDVAVAEAELRARSGVEKIVLVGLRLGATIAATAAAARGGVDGLVLWSPCLSGRAFVTEVTKQHKLYQRMDPELAPPEGEAPSPAPVGGQEALGLFVPDALAQELDAVDLLKLEKTPAGAVLIVDDGSLKANKDRLIAHLAALGVAPAYELHTTQRFLYTTSIRATVPFDVLKSIVDWIGEQHPPTAATARTHAAQQHAGGEQAVRFGSTHPLFGIYHAPASTKRDAAIVLINAGAVNRVGPHRLYVRMARAWAQLGFAVLRIDLSGLGDSPAAGADENLVYPPHAMADVKDAMRWLGDHAGVQRYIVAGLCSGGDLSFQTALHDDSGRVVSAVIMNPRTFCELDLEAVESKSTAAPGGHIANVPLALQKIAGRGVETLLVVSDRDPGVAYVDAHFRGDMEALAGLPHFTRARITRSDHTFTPYSVQEKVIALVTEHLLSVDGK